MLFTARALLILDLLEEVVAFIIDEDKRRKIFHFDFPDSFHPQFRIGHALGLLILCWASTAAGPPMLPR